MEDLLRGFGTHCKKHWEHDYVVPKLGSYALGYKVIVILDKHKVTMRETLLMSFTKGYAESNLYSGKSSTVAKLLNSGKIYTNSRKSTLAVGINMTNSGNALEHFIPNNPSLNLILHLQIKFLE
ncbi:hypothetical protein Tco_0845992 [Tanacetum coccineum]